MIVDTVFYNEKSIFRKTALLVTIPCAILPVLMASSLLMSPWHKPVLFKGDFLLAIPVYVVYLIGLYLSYKKHNKWNPTMLFVLHLVALVAVQQRAYPALMPYVAIFSLILTSVMNQYYRTGSPACDESCFR